jgi:DNA helicase IV
MDNYYFFEYDIENSNGYKSNIIDWDSPNTTINYNLSTNEQWYGDDQIVELYFNKLLTKRLFTD